MRSQVMAKAALYCESNGPHAAFNIMERMQSQILG